MSAPDRHGKPHHRWSNAPGGVYRCDDCPVEFKPGTPVRYRTSPEGEWSTDRPSCTRAAVRSPWPKPVRPRLWEPGTVESALADLRRINRSRRSSP